MKEEIGRKRSERLKERAHEDWLSDQKRQLLALRMQRAVAREQRESAAADERDSSATVQPYDPELGFCLLWDFVVGVPAGADGIQVID